MLFDTWNEIGFWDKVYEVPTKILKEIAVLECENAKIF